MTTIRNSDTNSSACLIWHRFTRVDPRLQEKQENTSSLYPDVYFDCSTILLYQNSDEFNHIKILKVKTTKKTPANLTISINTFVPLKIFILKNGRFRNWVPIRLPSCLSCSAVYVYISQHPSRSNDPSIDFILESLTTQLVQTSARELQQWVSTVSCRFRQNSDDAEDDDTCCKSSTGSTRPVVVILLKLSIHPSPFLVARCHHRHRIECCIHHHNHIHHLKNPISFSIFF